MWGYLQYRRGVQYYGGYHEYHGVILSTVGILMSQVKYSEILKKITGREDLKDSALSSVTQEPRGQDGVRVQKP